jgi:hypothetical protein
MLAPLALERPSQAFAASHDALGVLKKSVALKFPLVERGNPPFTTS